MSNSSSSFLNFFSQPSSSSNSKETSKLLSSSNNNSDSNSIVNSITNIFDSEPPKQPTLLEQFDEQTTLSFKNRLIGCGICIGVGLLFSILATIFFLSPTTFGILYTFSSIFYLGSTFFLVGPKRQAKNMCVPNRAIASFLFVASMAMTLYSAIGLESVVLVLLFVVLQLAALIWYTASYIPYTQDLMISCCKGIFAV
eukprot:TRINITY_DN1206_c0_g1_i1.p1 TRINITY_DN1206_c0_g1~~TRINITY_DN1206_c0_g1_i1.p1  ORF type:complete len:198 (+),score=44.03 TRINITY_DN1206_c0_g1_i1:123-716(+)